MDKKEFYKAVKEMRKCKKNEILDVIDKEIISLLQDDDKVTDFIVKVYKYFLPSISKKDRFIIAPIKKQEQYGPDFKRHIKVEDGKAYATDAKRLHVQNINLSDGFYDKHFHKLYEIDDDVSYPDTKKLVEDCAGYKGIQVTTVRNLLNDLDIINKDTATLNFEDALYKNKHLNPQYIIDTLSGLKDNCKIKIKYDIENEYSPLMIVCEEFDRLALIMPKTR